MSEQADIALIWLTVKPGTKSFVEKTAVNVLASQKESGNVRFELYSCGEDKYVLYEVYATKAAASAHKEQAHFTEWRPWLSEQLDDNGRDRRQYKAHGAEGGVEAFRGGDLRAGLETTLVHISCKPGTENAFIEATLKNKAGVEAHEPGALRFDILQQEDDPTKFVLFEAFKDGEAVSHHKTLGHYLTWRETVEDMMAEKRRGEKVQFVSIAEKPAEQTSSMPMSVDHLIPFFMIFGGCMGSIVFMEYALKFDKNSGNFLNATEFLVVLLQSIPGRIELDSGRLKPLVASRSSHAIHAGLWVVMSTLANYVFAFHISIPIHTLFRSCNVIASVVIGFLAFQQRYTLRQIACVCVITVGIFLGSIGDASVITGGGHSNTTSTNTACVDCGSAPAPASGLGSDLAVWSAGVAMLICCQILQAFLGHKQAEFYQRFSEKAPKSVLADEYLFTSHVASMFAIFALWDDISTSAQLAWSTPPLSAYFPLPRGFLWVVLNNITQLSCIKGVFRLSAMYSPLTVNITLSVRKFMSVMVSIIWFGNAWTTLHSIALVSIFGGVFAYSQCPKVEPKEKKA